MATTAILMTADDLLRLPDDGTRRELVRGELQSISPASYAHGKLIATITYYLTQHVRQHQLGEVCGAETGFILETDPDTIWAPDVAFVGNERAELFGNERGYGPAAPDLAIEVISPNDLYVDVQDKVTEYLNAGTGMVVIVNPRNKTIQVHRALGGISNMTVDDTIDGENVVPGWTCPVRSIFE